MECIGGYSASAVLRETGSHRIMRLGQVPATQIIPKNSLSVKKLPVFPAVFPLVFLRFVPIRPFPPALSPENG